MRKLVPLLFCAVLPAACTLDPKDYETAPVTVTTAQGPVVCQLYTRELVTWDRSTDRPDKMSVEQADAVCLAEGRRRKAS